MKKLFLAVVALIVAVLPLGAEAAMIQSGTSYVLDGSQTLDESLYASGGTISVAGKVEGDVVVAGGSVTVSGTVMGDVLATGGTLNITGTVTDDVRVAGGQILIDTNIPGDLNVAGGSVTVTHDSLIGGDILIAGGTVELFGEVAGDIHGAGEEVTLDGTIGGSVRLYADRVTLLRSARISGDLVYSSEREATLEEGALVLGELTHNTYSKMFPGNLGLGIAGLLITGWIFKLITTLIAALLLFLIFTRLSGSIIRKNATSFWKQAGIGFLIAVVGPIAAGLLFITIIGSAVAGAVLAVYVFLLVLAGAYAGILAGNWIFRWLRKDKNFSGNWASISVGVIVLSLFYLLPPLLLINVVFFLSALGAVGQFGWEAVRGSKNK
ncbi:MAG: hypothetical protein Q8Q20_04155 [bacterium]|nr:hypothetical protein [bacterium]